MARGSLGKLLSACAFAALLGAWPLGAPASAFGRYTHALIAERAYHMLVPSYPWLAAQQEPFFLGAATPDLYQMPGLGALSKQRTHATGTLAPLWQDARSPDARAFVLGWAVHLASDEVEAETLLAPSALPPVRQALQPHSPAPEALEPLIDWAVDSALFPQANGTLEIMNRSTLMSANPQISPAIMRLVARNFGVDEGAFWQWMRFLASSSAGGDDRYLQLEARWQHVEPWADKLRTPAVRQALGDLRPIVARSVEASVAQVKQFYLNAAPAKH